MRTLRLFVTVMLAVGFLPLAAESASAAPPGNDEPNGAVVLTLGAEVEQDTTQATTNAQDAALNEGCGAPETNASVWYKYTSSVDRNVVLDMTSSDYSGGMLVFEGTPTIDSLVACGAGMVGINAEAGKTYYVMVISDTEVNGGKLVLTLDKAPPPPKVHVTIARRGVAYRGGAARVHGWYSCRYGDFAKLYGTLMQRAGRLKIPGDIYKELGCNGVHRRWSARVVSATGIYARGRARVWVELDACGVFECRADTAKRRIRLHRAAAHGPNRQRLLRQVPDRLQLPRPLVEQQRHWPTS